MKRALFMFVHMGFFIIIIFYWFGCFSLIEFCVSYTRPFPLLIGYGVLFQADRNDVEDQPPAKRRLSSAVVKVSINFLLYGNVCYLVSVNISTSHSRWTFLIYMLLVLLLWLNLNHMSYKLALDLDKW